MSLGVVAADNTRMVHLEWEKTCVSILVMMAISNYARESGEGDTTAI